MCQEAHLAGCPLKLDHPRGAGNDLDGERVGLVCTAGGESRAFEWCKKKLALGAGRTAAQLLAVQSGYQHPGLHCRLDGPAGLRPATMPLHEPAVRHHACSESLQPPLAGKTGQTAEGRRAGSLVSRCSLYEVPPTGSKKPLESIHWLHTCAMGPAPSATLSPDSALPQPTSAPASRHRKNRKKSLGVD